MKKIYLLLIFSCLFLSLHAQYSLKGVILNIKGEKLENAIVQIPASGFTTQSKMDGTFVIKNLSQGDVSILIALMGYQSVNKIVNINGDASIEIILQEAVIMTDEVVVMASKLSDKAPFTAKKLSRTDIAERNVAEDVPSLLQMTPSVVSTTESGIGIGYSGLRVRGSDPTRTNVTINGIPLNDSESQSVFWVNLPELSSNAQSIQVQRGVGSSTLGAGAFGATVQIETNYIDTIAHASGSYTVGSFNTQKYGVALSTGLINNKLAVDASYSGVTSDGYVDYAFTKQKAFTLGSAYKINDGLIKLNVMIGEEHTGISWWGCPVDSLSTNRTYNPAGQYIDENGVQQHYDGQADNYWQNHYQLFFSKKLNQQFHFNAAVHFTKGFGYYEQYEENQAFSDYYLPSINIGGTEITESDMIVQKKMENWFYGGTASLQYQKNSLKTILGASANRYLGDHWGEVIWARYAGNTENDYTWYRNYGDKTDISSFLKLEYAIADFNLYADVQYRHIDYALNGLTDDGYNSDSEYNYDFFNPKLGVFYKVNDNHSFYISDAIAHKEPTRSNYLDALSVNSETPKPEMLYDTELGYDFKNQQFVAHINGYYMYYVDQLVPIGQKNSSGYDRMTNVDESYRLGVEVEAGVRFLKICQLDANATVSQNKIINYQGVVSSYDDAWNETLEQQSLGNTDIAYSPSVVAGAALAITPVKGLKATWLSKYVGEQYFDNTSSINRMLDAYFINNLQLDYTLKFKGVKSLDFQFLTNNLFDVEYVSNGYGGYWKEQGTELNWAYMYAQAGRHFFFKTTLNF